ncbi:polysaccharide biosynthesis tyrosine autokinase [Planctomycetaceae bacterium SH139]
MQQPSVQYAPVEMGTQPAAGMPQAGGASLLGVAWRRKGILIFFLLCGLGGGFWYHSTQDETFASLALVEVYRQQNQTSTGSAIEEVQDLTPTVVFIDAEIKSDKVLKAAIEIGQLGAFPGMPSEPGAVLGVLREGLTVAPPFESGAEGKDRTMVQVKYVSTDPGLSSAAVNAIVQAYEEYVNGRHQTAILSVKNFFSEAKGSILPQLKTLEEEYSEFRGEAPLEWSANGEAINPYREDAIRLEDNAYQIETELRQLDSKVKLIEETGKGQSSAVAVLREVQYLLDDVSGISEMQQAIVDAPNADVELKTKLMGLRVQADLLADLYAANHPQRQVIESELASTEKALREIQQARELDQPESVDVGKRQEEAARSLLRSYRSGLKKKLQLLEGDLTDVRLRLEEVRGRAHTLIAFENKNASYMRQIGRLQEMLNSFDGQLEKASLPLLNPGLQVNVLRPAGMGARVGPEILRNLLLGGILGLAVGGMIGWLVDWSERTYRNPDEVAQNLGIPIMTHLPMMLLKKKKKGDPEGDFDSIDRVITVMHDPHSPGAEAIRSVRTALFATATKEAEYQIIQVTSALPGDGKSTVAANLASSVARANKRVLVIDADLRRPTQSALFGVEAGLGLSSVLNGDCLASEAMFATAVEGLYVMPTGPKPNNPSEALMLPEFGAMLDDLRADFDMIIVDTPPLLAVTDASNVATHVDGVMFVMRIGRNVKPMSKRAVTMLRGLHVNIIGVIVNAIGDSGYSATYANAWSTSYGGQPGSEYGYGYYRYGSDRYLNASKGQSVTVKGKSDNRKSRVLEPAALPSSNGHHEKPDLFETDDL